MLKIKWSLHKRLGAFEHLMSFLQLLFYPELAALRQSKHHTSYFQPSLIHQALMRSCIVLMSEHLTEVNKFDIYLSYGYSRLKTRPPGSSLWKPHFSSYISVLHSAMFVIPSSLTSTKWCHSSTEQSCENVIYFGSVVPLAILSFSRVQNYQSVCREFPKIQGTL